MDHANKERVDLDQNGCIIACLQKKTQSPTKRITLQKNFRKFDPKKDPKNNESAAFSVNLSDPLCADCTKGCARKTVQWPRMKPWHESLKDSSWLRRGDEESLRELRNVVGPWSQKGCKQNRSGVGQAQSLPGDNKYFGPDQQTWPAFQPGNRSWPQEHRARGFPESPLRNRGKQNKAHQGPQITLHLYFSPV